MNTTQSGKRRRLYEAFAAAGLLLLGGVLSASPAVPGTHGMAHGAVDSEFDFLVDMIPHHQEAVDASRETAARTSRPELRAFALLIARDQAEEIRTMKGWLESWHPGRKTDSRYTPMMRPAAGLAPDEADRFFLEDMIEHHRAAVTMAVRIRDGQLSGRPELLEMADAIIRNQNAEIGRMEGWLRNWYGAAGGKGHGGH